QAKTLYVLRVVLEDRADLGAGLVEAVLGEPGLGEDQPRRRVLGIACEALAAQRDGVLGPSRLAIEVGELRERQRPGIAREPLLVAAHGGEERVVRHQDVVISVSAARTSSARTSMTILNCPI